MPGLIQRLTAIITTYVKITQAARHKHSPENGDGDVIATAAYNQPASDNNPSPILTNHQKKMEKQPATNYDGAQTTGVRVDDPSADGLDRDRAYDSGFKYQIPEAGQQNTSEPSYQPHAAVGADSKFRLFA